MSLEKFIRALPKVELHVHLEGAIQPETLLILARRNGVVLPYDTIGGLREWYTFTDFESFKRVYLKISECIRTPDDIELIAREFLARQASQSIVYTEVTYTAWTHYHLQGLSFHDQLAAINRARVWAEAELDTRMSLVIDIPRTIPADEGLRIADWAIGAMGDGVVALGLGGPEVDNPPERYREAFERAHVAGLPAVPHAGETAGAESIWSALHAAYAQRIGHGVRCLEDPTLVAELRTRQIPLEVCPTSNVCLKVVPQLSAHPLPELLAQGLYITINSDDPPLFHTTLANEYQSIAQTFHLGPDDIEQLVLNAVRASFLTAEEQEDMEAQFVREFAHCRSKHIAD